MLSHSSIARHIRQTVLPLALLWSASAAANCPATPDLTLAAADLALKAGNTDAVHQALACLIPVATALKNHAENRQPQSGQVIVKHVDVPMIVSPLPGH